MRRGFTLIELLIVIGIVAVLISFLLPVMARIRGESHRIVCASNLQSLAKATLVYASTYGGWVPRDYTQEQPKTHPFWAELLARTLGYKLPAPVKFPKPETDAKLAPYFAAMPVFQCPSFPNPDQPLDYVYNGWNIDNPGVEGPLTRISRLGNPSRLIVITEGIHKLNTANFEFHDVFGSGNLPLAGSPRICNDRRHRGLINSAYLDGHVSAMPFTKLTSSEFRRAN